MSLQQQLSFRQSIPPSFGHDKDWEMRLVGWYERNNENPKEPQHVTAMVFRGMAVDEGLHEYYWEAYANFREGGCGLGKERQAHGSRLLPDQ